MIPYPEWAHAVGWTLVGLSAVQVPLWAILQTLYYAYQGNVSQVVKPLPIWGPGDKTARREMLEEQAGIETHRFSYDNNGMPYEAYQQPQAPYTITCDDIR